MGKEESEYYYSLMYVFYHMPVIFTLVFTGIVCDIYGPPIISLTFAIICSIGKPYFFNGRLIFIFVWTDPENQRNHDFRPSFGRTWRRNLNCHQLFLDCLTVWKKEYHLPKQFHDLCDQSCIYQQFINHSITE